jgi:predicted O-linked N-acetylglucosamine transferase (SPINDLY family)
MSTSQFQNISHSQLIEEYEMAIAQDTTDRQLYWKLGNVYLLNGQEDDAQMLWMSVLSEAGSEVEMWTQELFSHLWNQAIACEEQEEQSLAFLFYSYMCEIFPASASALLKLLQTAINLEDVETLESSMGKLTERLQSVDTTLEDEALLLNVLSQILEKIPAYPGVGDLLKASVFYIREPFTLMKLLLPHAVRIAHGLRRYSLAIEISEAYLLIDPNNYEFLGHLASFYQNAGAYENGIVTAKRHLELASSLVDKIFSSHLVLRGLLSAGGSWNGAVQASKVHIQMLSSLNSEDTKDLFSAQTLRLFTSSYYLPYFKDSFSNRSLINSITQLCQESVCSYALPFDHDRHLEKTGRNHDISPSQKIRIGYLSHCMCQHSVGWLARWLIQHHDREKFEFYGYFINDRPYDSLYRLYFESFDHSCCLETEFGQDTQAFARRIYDDGIDILIDLDSITLDVSCEILAMKPAPIQATWLGWDAIGMSAIDYFIADPYVLPDNAQEFYTEKIWRLPDTYLGVDGFEVAVPTLTRESLNISSESVTFLTAQRGYKRHRDTAILQMQIIADTPNSYLLIKGFADDQAIQNFFYEIADEVGVDRDRLRFLESDPSEAIHRANLRIADVVLDTYPYNGATTTMETLWMEVPIVTRVGQQFAARNSYTMMMNVGITEGIAWSAEEYVEWGIKLGTDPQLRQEVCWKLRQSKKTSPLWNGKQFARQMEDAYQQMWNSYVLNARNSNNI